MLRTALPTQHAHALRWSLLLALGLTPLVACGGSVVTRSEGDAGSTAEAGAAVGGANGGASNIAGAPHRGGMAGATEAYCDSPGLDPVSGLVTCMNGFAHRPAAQKCELPPEVGAAGSSSEAGAGPVDPYQTCTTDEDCHSWPLGYCKLIHTEIPGLPKGGFGPSLNPRCSSGCLQDSDCGQYAICLCDGSATGGKCVFASCGTDADCGPRAFCASESTLCGGNNFSCTSVLDECVSDHECGQVECSSRDDNHRTCKSGNCGRPFLVEEAARFAEVEPRRDWFDATISPNLSGLSPLERAELAAHWSRLGQMEHASIAAFARFNLQLLALGAPADLVESCNQALVDETAHARLCFAFASAYAGTKLGPSKLDMSHCFEETTLLSVTQLVISEGCIGETVAALEALADAERATDPVVKAALFRIASDERNHAELAYRFVRWALEQCTPQERRLLAREAEQRIADFESNAHRDEQRMAARLVVRPLLRTMLDEQETA